MRLSSRHYMTNIQGKGGFYDDKSEDIVFNKKLGKANAQKVERYWRCIIGDFNRNYWDGGSASNHRQHKGFHYRRG